MFSDIFTLMPYFSLSSQVVIFSPHRNSYFLFFVYFVYKFRALVRRDFNLLQTDKSVAVERHFF